MTIITTGILMSGCSILASNMVSELRDTFGEDIEYYTQLKPEMQRVLALESDMKVIIDELGKQSKLGTDPLADPTDFVDTTANYASSQRASLPNDRYCDVVSNFDIKPCNSAVQNTGHCHRKIGIHIAAFSDSKFVSSGWLHIKELLPASLKEKYPLSAPINKDDVTYHSLRIGPFTSVAKAKQACETLVLPMKCSVTEYYGKRLIKVG